MTKKYLIPIIIAIVVGALGFFGGMQYQKSQRSNAFSGSRQFNNGNGARISGVPGRNGFNGNRPVSGEITSLADSTMTVKTQDGSSKIIIISDSTKINLTSAGSKSDLKVGDQAMVIGTDSNDTITAQTISTGENIFPDRPDNQSPTPGN